MMPFLMAKILCINLIYNHIAQFINEWHYNISFAFAKEVENLIK